MEKLTDAECRNAGPGELHDGGGLFLDVKKTGSRSWKFRWTAMVDGKAKRSKMGLGAYPAVSLKRAREKAQECRKAVAEGRGPRKLWSKPARSKTFKDVSYEFFDLYKGKLKGDGEAGRWLSPLKTHVFPKIGNRPIAELSLDDLVEVIWPINGRDVGRKALDRINLIMDHARGREQTHLSDVKRLVKAQLPRTSRKSVGHPALDWRDMPGLWLALGDSVAHIGLKFYLLNVPRTSNVTQARWDEIDMQAGVWDIPPETTKTGEPFAAPLARQSMDLLRIAKRHFVMEGNDHIFPSPTARKKGVISENTWGKWLKDHDWKAADGRHAVAHGFRATFATWCGDEQVCEKDMAVRCIQHKVENAADAAYLRSRLLPQRRAVMQRWADFVTSGELAAQEAHRRKEEQKSYLESYPEKPGRNGEQRTGAEIEEWYRRDNEDDKDLPTGAHEEDMPNHLEIEKWAADYVPPKK
ncbi:integrase arm-type DNA-binding domain-containing protein [Roseivivax sp. THAF197b]|uniref:tyrosine-type recombinase/integrase n=1 Tax=Roseivivax sp. THAF197b TaxID=2588299 RepID=UPI001C12CC5D|nr:integrase arm-type DNA-binding domain-containing protein [Roseivivax sp. THAF197b]